VGISSGRRRKKDKEPGEAEEDPSINKEKKVLAIDLHYDALVPNGHIDSTHVHKIMGYKIKSEDEENRLIAQWQDWKKEVRVWAAFEIKQKMKEEALQITQDGQFVTPTVNGYKVSKFLDIKKWWAMAPADCHKSEATFFHLAYGMWEKFWKRTMEEQFMNAFGWTYDQEVKEKAQKECGQAGYVMKGCVAKNIAHVKGEIVKGLQKKG
jgi:hypothetical protein